MAGQDTDHCELGGVARLKAVWKTWPRHRSDGGTLPLAETNLVDRFQFPADALTGVVWPYFRFTMRFAMSKICPPRGAAMRFTKRSDVRRSNSDYTCRGPALAKGWLKLRWGDGTWGRARQITHSDISIGHQKSSAGGVTPTKICVVIRLLGRELTIQSRT